MLRRLTAVLATALISVPLAAAPASASTGYCLPISGSARCQVWTGKVAWVADGDTMLVDIYGDGTRTPKSVRIIGMQAMEQKVYSPNPKKRRGECHALAATARAEQLVKAGGGIVRMTALRASSKSKGRPLRSISVKINGQWRDIGADLVRRGLTLWQPFAGEWAADKTYRRLEALAARDRLNLFDTDSCGRGPYQSTALSVWVNSDADGEDSKNLNGEWVRIGNDSGASIRIDGWWVRDSGLRRYTFPANTVVPAHGAVFLHVGRGRNTATHKYWGLTAPVFENVGAAAHVIGDGAYLFDRQGDVRAWMQYPCLTGCTSPLTGKVSLTVREQTVEHVKITNTSAAAVDLFGHVLVNKPYRYPFLNHTVLQPGETLTMYTGSGTNSGLTRYWKKTGSILNDDGDAVSLQTKAEYIVECVKWGGVSC
ncbi:endonuclease YncB(thermonuclease family) [Krasilnikovia cinnamomea]|uniref:Endonuclease YncB(Thermonuclease family) n=1 Tax=Krasilnikovia cinnamomea TaxID=349313 RepID=A0A4Q7ZDD6_9ACTN|nr:lamin tail domain-containing protein [Krasilnikovia cinnamomea]RZU48658.1 endonuclease YncB(thermonuclease family) [Krasilnikovia cinnamomea]